MRYIESMVREMVKSLGYKQTAIDIGVSETAVRNWLKKDIEINIHSCKRVEDAYKLFKGADY
ncbi:MAG: hypothetical protein HF967_03430 [Methanosarcinales archaeon]|nr:hypothetical protein [Methanosarcinales archaeon]